ncbi:MAG: hypothetical protein R3339_05990, partial [Thermodesulfobacteriota bacterium]|nr:hypothetical protein [Thermodesulfobacteriota bacterium]
MIRTVRKLPLFRTGFCLCFLVLCVSSDSLEAFEVNDDGRALILEAQQTYHSDMENRPVITDTVITGYVTKIVKGLVPKGKTLPPG